MQSFLAKYQPASPMSDEELFKKKRDAWQQERIFVITPEQMAKLGNKEHETVVNIATRIYGGRA